MSLCLTVLKLRIPCWNCLMGSVVDSFWSEERREHLGICAYRKKYLILYVSGSGLTAWNRHNRVVRILISITPALLTYLHRCFCIALLSAGFASARPGQVQIRYRKAFSCLDFCEQVLSQNGCFCLCHCQWHRDACPTDHRTVGLDCIYGRKRYYIWTLVQRYRYLKSSYWEWSFRLCDTIASQSGPSKEQRRKPQTKRLFWTKDCEVLLDDDVTYARKFCCLQTYDPFDLHLLFLKPTCQEVIIIRPFSALLFRRPRLGCNSVVYIYTIYILGERIILNTMALNIGIAALDHRCNNAFFHKCSRHSSVRWSESFGLSNLGRWPCVVIGRKDIHTYVRQPLGGRT